MKKNNTYLTDDEIDLNDLIKVLWREKILILSISIVCGLIGYLFASFKDKEFKTEITIKNPPIELFETYYFPPFNNNNNNNNNNKVAEQFINNFKLNFLSLDNLQSFVEESKEFDNFKEYLKSRNISAKKYFVNKINQVKEKNLIIPNKFFLVFSKELDGDIFFNDYAEFIKKKTIVEIKKNLKLSIENKIIIFENALLNAKLINLENPILRSTNQQIQVVNDPEALFYKGSKILSQEIIHLKKLFLKLENEQFNFEMIVDKPFNSPVEATSNFIYVAAGLIFGLFLSLGIVFFKNTLKNN
jgi:LPS O-antigen subunit length determinant protein (WzzB/FepE family)